MVYCREIKALQETAENHHVSKCRNGVCPMYPLSKDVTLSPILVCAACSALVFPSLRSHVCTVCTGGSSEGGVSNG